MTREPAAPLHAPLEDEAEHVRRAREGDRGSYGALVTHYQGRLYAAAVALVRNHEDARDLSQEAFVRAYRHLARFDLSRPFYPWIHRILRNLCLDHLQKHGPHRSVSYDELVEESHVAFESRDGHLSSAPEDPRENIQREQMARHLRAGLDRLKPEFREILVMRHFDELSYQEIADSLEIPIGTVMSRLYHARRALAGEMKDLRHG